MGCLNWIRALSNFRQNAGAEQSKPAQHPRNIPPRHFNFLHQLNHQWSASTTVVNYSRSGAPLKTVAGRLVPQKLILQERTVHTHIGIGPHVPVIAEMETGLVGPDLEFKIFREDIVVCPRDSSLLGVVEVCDQHAIYTQESFITIYCEFSHEFKVWSESVIAGRWWPQR
jgi:hypothetical protein